MFARPFIDSLDFAHRGEELRGEMPLAELPRLQDILAAPEGKVSFVLQGSYAQDGKPRLELSLESLCVLRCQRCLDGLSYPVRLVSKLKLVSDEDESDIDDDEMDSIPVDKHLDVLSLIEEEMLLSLPIAPMHAVGECQIAAKGLARSENPFAVLAGLKR